MKIAIASGKGGTGKTTLAVNLALTALASGASVTLMDCDVEEPNVHLFLGATDGEAWTVAIPKPKVIEARCNGCGVCAEVCEFNALTVIGDQVLVFNELCHGCGACQRLCPEGAIVEEDYAIGAVASGRSRGLRLVQGRLNVGEVMTPAVIRQVRRRGEGDGVCLIDAPPGTSCPVIEAVRGTDFVLLTTEPTPFGLNDLALAVEMVRALALPFAVALNRCDSGDDAVRDYCRREGIAIVLALPEDRRIAETYARGEILLDKLPDYRTIFSACWQRLVLLADGPGTGEQKRGEGGVR